MSSTLLAAATLTVTSVLPLPLPLPAGAGDEPAVEAAPVVPSGVLSAPDSRLRRGCKSYAYAYSVTTDSEDWTFESGVLPYRLCRGATAPDASR